MHKSTYEIVKLDCGHTTVDTRNDLLGDGDGVDMLRVEAVTQPRDTGSDLVELNALLASICRLDQQLGRNGASRGCDLPLFFTYMAAT